MNQTLFIPPDAALIPFLKSICLDVNGFLSETKLVNAFLNALTIPDRRLNTSTWTLGVPIKTVSCQLTCPLPMVPDTSLPSPLLSSPLLSFAGPAW